MTKATAGERLVRSTLGIDDDYADKIAKRIDRLLARERAKVAEDVLAMLEVIASDWPHWHQEIKEKVRAKYGKGKR